MCVSCTLLCKADEKNNCKIFVHFVFYILEGGKKIKNPKIKQNQKSPQNFKIFWSISLNKFYLRD